MTIRKRNDGCTGCPRGKRGTIEEAVNETTGCKDCIGGRFSDLEGVSTTHITDDIFCKPCAVGKWNDQVKSTKESDCQNCNAGRYSTKIAASEEGDCVNCRKGSYLDSVGANEIILKLLTTKKTLTHTTPNVDLNDCSCIIY
jgi:hypothetical protein